MMLSPRGKGILGTSLRNRNEVRDERDYFDDIPSVRVPKDMLDLAKHILETKRTKLDPAKFEDRYESALKKLIATKRAGKKPPAVPAPEPSNVIDLMDALRPSVAGKRRSASARRGKRAHGAARPRKLKRAR
jgi:DNA end-binding protein Ku